jgi:hypothetical protein
MLVCLVSTLVRVATGLRRDTAIWWATRKNEESLFHAGKMGDISGGSFIEWEHSDVQSVSPAVPDKTQ